MSGQAYNSIDEAWNIDVWEYTNPDFLVPVQKWMTLKIYFLEGNECSGRFTFTITPDGEPETVVHDVRNFTHRPSNLAPDGLKHFNPFKLYTSDDRDSLASFFQPNLCAFVYTKPARIALICWNKTITFLRGFIVRTKHKCNGVVVLNAKLPLLKSFTREFIFLRKIIVIIL